MSSQWPFCLSRLKMFVDGCHVRHDLLPVGSFQLDHVCHILQQYSTDHQIKFKGLKSAHSQCSLKIHHRHTEYTN